MAAVGAGYLLGRRTAKLADIPEVAKLVETIRGELMPAAQAAAFTAVNSRIDSLNRRLESGAADRAAGTRRRSDEVRDSRVVEAEEPPEADEPAEGEQKRKDGKLPENEGEEQHEGKFETDESEEETDESEEIAQPEQEEPPRRSPRTRRTRGAHTAKEIREWAVQQGYEISARGRIAADIEQAFRDAH